MNPELFREDINLVSGRGLVEAEMKRRIGMIRGRDPKFEIGEPVRAQDFPGEVHRVKSFEAWISFDGSDFEPVGDWHEAEHGRAGLSLADETEIRIGGHVVDADQANYDEAEVKTIADAQYFYFFDELDPMPESEIYKADEELTDWVAAVAA